MTTEQERHDALKKLREPFKPEQIGKIPRGNVKLDYVGHANVSARLLNVDPEWSWEPVAFDANGLPALIYNQNGAPIGLWIKLTVCGVTRYGFGSCEANKFDPIKELIGDAIRNAAMRFGVALDLWSKEELETAHDDKDQAGTEQSVPAAAQQPTTPPPSEQAEAPAVSTTPSVGASPAWEVIQKAVTEKRTSAAKVAAAASRIALQNNAMPEGGISYSTAKDLDEDILLAVVHDLGLNQGAMA